MSGTQYESLKEEGVVAERGGRLPAGADQRAGQVSGPLDHPHALAATAGRWFDKHRVADLLGRRDQFVVAESGPCDTGNHGHAERRHGALGSDLVTHGLDGTHRRTDESHSRRCQRGSEIGILRKKSVARVHGLGSGAYSCVDDGVDVEVTITRGRRADRDRQVRRGNMACVGVHVAEDRHRPNAHRLQRPDHPDRDLTPVCNQYGIEAHHVTSGRRRKRPARRARLPLPKAQGQQPFWYQQDRSRRRPRAGLSSSKGCPGTRIGRG